MRIPGGIRAKLALALLAIVGIALGGAYLMIVPSLERRLVAAKLDQLERQGRPLASGLPADTLDWSRYVSVVAFVTNARVAVVQLLSQTPPTLAVLQDSRQTSSSDIAGDPVAIAAGRSGSVQRARVRRGQASYAEVAVPLSQGQIVLFSAPLADQLSTVAVVKRRIAYAAAVALGLAAALGVAAAAVLSRRIRRLERAANRIAEGSFDEPVVDLGDDEIGQLARAFDHMRRQLAQLDGARRAFVANASHELRTPLFSLGGFIELLSDEDLDEETRRDFLRTTRQQVERLTTLATDLLDLSRMDAGRIRIEREDVNIAEVARAVVDELRALAETSDHILVADAEQDTWAVADEERVLQIGRALARNALIHTPPGTYVTVRAGRHDDRAALMIEDDGPGIASDQLDRIFERFYRADGSQASGSGLGLAIARELAQRMDGAVEVESVPGHTVFTVWLPSAPVVAAQLVGV